MVPTIFITPPLIIWLVPTCSNTISGQAPSSSSYTMIPARNNLMSVKSTAVGDFPLTSALASSMSCRMPQKFCPLWLSQIPSFSRRNLAAWHRQWNIRPSRPSLALDILDRKALEKRRTQAICIIWMVRERKSHWRHLYLSIYMYILKIYIYIYMYIYKIFV